MSLRRAAELLRERAARATALADQQRVSESTRGEFRRLVQKDPAALDWVMRRVAQELELAATDCLALADQDVTVIERGRRG